MIQRRLRWLGLLSSWAFLVLALGVTAIAVAGEVINLRDLRRLDRVVMIDRMIKERTGNKAEILRSTATARSAQLDAMKSKVDAVAKQTDDVPDTGQTIIVSTAENHVYVRRGGQKVFDAVCSTGKGTTLAIDGRTMVFDTPIGKFHVQSKEENPQWVPPDWHYVEQARKNGMRVVRLNPGQTIDARTGGAPAPKRDEGIWSWFGDSNNSGGSGSTMHVKGDTVVVNENGVERELPPGQMIVAGDAIVIPPINTKQRHFDKVLGHYRLNLGDGYALHGTQETENLGRSVSHGCVRLGDADIQQLYQMANVGDVVIIY
jgi:lipoprotein-anchoring transpeptidase ErfK/SrfK